MGLHSTTPVALTTNKMLKRVPLRAMKTSSFKSNENIQKKEGKPECIVSNNEFSSVTLDE